MLQRFAVASSGNERTDVQKKSHIHVIILFIEGCSLSTYIFRNDWSISWLAARSSIADCAKLVRVLLVHVHRTCSIIKRLDCRSLAVAEPRCGRASMPSLPNVSFRPSSTAKVEIVVMIIIVNLTHHPKLPSNPQACIPTSASTLVTPSLSPSPAGNSQTRPNSSASALRPWQLHFLVRL
jgi:hypothetical protein